MNVARFLLVLSLLTLAERGAFGQSTPNAQGKQAPSSESGQIVIAGKSTPYVIRHLPVSSFPGLPVTVAEILNQRGCTIPQTYEAHRPENVVHASLERPGSSDWAVLCSAGGTVSLIVFFDNLAGNSGAQPTVLASTSEIKRLQTYPGGVALGFNWGIDPASPEQIHLAQSGLENRPARVDHDALADSVFDHNTIYHFYAQNTWTVLAMPN